MTGHVSYMKQPPPEKPPRKPMRRRSSKRQRQEAQYLRDREVFLKARQYCEMRLDGCTGWATEVHHQAGRQGYRLLDQSRWLPGCSSCHRYATDNSQPLRTQAHRWLYERWVGPIPDGLVIVNPLHVEPVTVRENVLRGVGPTAVAARRATCKRGHPYDKAVVWAGIPRRVCSICRKAGG